jgi:hypothetical protein
MYNTEREQLELRRLERYFFNGLIYNPNRPNIQYSKNPMAECLAVVRSQTITALAFSHDLGRIPSGVHDEIRAAKNKGMPIYKINLESIEPFSGAMRLVKNSRNKDWARV